MLSVFSHIRDICQDWLQMETLGHLSRSQEPLLLAILLPMSLVEVFGPLRIHAGVTRWRSACRPAVNKRTAQ